MLVEWVDSAVMAGTWRDRQDAIDAVAKSMATHIVSVGIVVHEDDDAIMLAVTWNPNPDDIQGAILIPKAVVKSMHPLSLGRWKR